MNWIFSTILILVIPTFVNSDPTRCQFSPDGAKESAKSVGVLAVQLYQKLATPDENIIFSPLSIALALAMVESGTGGETRQEIQRLLTFPGSDQNGSVEKFQALQHQILNNATNFGISPENEKAKLSIANGFFRADGLILKSEYENKVKQCFETEIATAPFATNTEQARIQVNRWVSDKTGGKIPELFQKDSIKSNTLAILANAVYMKAFWSDRFYESEFVTLPFYQSGRTDRAQSVPFMVQQKHHNYISKPTYNVVELQYKESHLSMYIILPKQRDGMDSVEKSLNGQELLSLFGTGGDYRKIILKLPKFAVRQKIELGSILEGLGIKKMFSAEPDFSRMVDGNRIKLAKALHEAYIKVHENGTEAAAVTAIMLAGAGLNPATEPPPIPFIVDHPFMYAIVHKPTSAIVFMGKVNSVKQDE